VATGTIFGIYEALEGISGSSPEEQAMRNALQKGTALVAAGYALYSSATMLVVTFGLGTHGFTLDPALGEYVVTHPNMKIPKRGQIYSVNDARYHDWPEGLRNYIDAIRQGRGQSPKQYSARYICSLVGDFHRTLLYGTDPLLTPS
jgi:fructose-1,6-bisphosphatase I